MLFLVGDVRSVGVAGVVSARLVVGTDVFCRTQRDVLSGDRTYCWLVSVCILCTAGR